MASQTDEKVLVTGGNGAIGQLVLEELSRRKVPSVVVSRSGWYSDDPLVTSAAADIRDVEAIRSIMADNSVTRIIHLAAILLECESDPLAGFGVNFTGTLTLLEAARQSPGFRRFVFASSKSAFGTLNGEWGHPNYSAIKEDHLRRPNATYGMTKKVAEDAVTLYREHYELDAVVARFGTTCGPGKGKQHGSSSVTSAMIEGAVDGVPVEVAQGGDERDDIIYNLDIAAGLVQAALQPVLAYHTYHLGSGELVTLRDLANAIKAVIPEADIKVGDGLDYMGLRMGNYCLMDIERAKSDLGFIPHPLADWVRDYIDRYRAAKHLTK
ncbi:NAD(P)-dependent oxidoreductase [Chelativorans sp. Marseille-P2723]|uniref:NAD-dependent epimerase/dehydratase family protein n=1 Tax=Chelativorans sp. Marseille-P2723 TaxID=2709133 RepID=UPI00156F09E4|nr:NAD(P)-dependent oxidoreductase [Chelativorans sp. Marseille-P2723]